MDFIVQDDEYIKERYLREYRSFLNNLVKYLDNKTTNKDLHEFHKEKFGMYSMKDISTYTSEELMVKLKLIEAHWSVTGLVFTP